MATLRRLSARSCRRRPNSLTVFVFSQRGWQSVTPSLFYEGVTSRELIRIFGTLLLRDFGAGQSEDLVRIAGLEPARLTPLPPQSSASANSAICAKFQSIMKQQPVFFRKCKHCAIECVLFTCGQFESLLLIVGPIYLFLGLACPAFVLNVCLKGTLQGHQSCAGGLPVPALKPEGDYALGCSRDR